MLDTKSAVASAGRAAQTASEKPQDVISSRSGLDEDPLVAAERRPSAPKHIGAKVCEPKALVRDGRVLQTKLLERAMGHGMEGLVCMLFAQGADGRGVGVGWGSGDGL